MKDGCAVVFNEKRKKRRKTFPFGRASNVRGNGLPLIADAPLWMDTRWSEGPDGGFMKKGRISSHTHKIQVLM